MPTAPLTEAARRADPDASPVGERLAYVGGLDGVRAFAVLAVMAFHAGVAHTSGGFLGVDVFFVLSGFLITSLLLAEAKHRNTIRLAQFWARRARRLLPALLVVLCFVNLFGWLAAQPGTYPELRLDSLSTLLYVANWHFILEGTSYFQQALAPSPLTHTWSLAIEEQFYVVWPLLVLALVKLGRAPRTLLVVATLGALASTAWMWRLYADGANETRLYYGTDTHAMTLLCGAALACVLALLAKDRDVGELRARGMLGAAVQGVGFAGAAIVVAMVLKVSGTGSFVYQGGFLVAGLATAAVLLSVVTVPAGPLGAVLSLSPVRFVGRISYGLYLWHYPLFQWLDAERTGLSGLHLLAVRAVVTFAVATASFYFIERPIRHGLVLRGLRAATVTATALAGTVALVFATTLASAAPAAIGGVPQPPYRDPVRALLIGDSTALTLGIALAPWAHLYDVRLADDGILGCGVTVSDAQIEHGQAIPTAWPCRRQPYGHETIEQYWRAEVASFAPQVVAILAGRWEVHNLLIDGKVVNIEQPGFRAAVVTGLTEAVDIAKSRGAHVVLVTQPCTDSGEQADGAPWPEDSPRRLAIYNGIVRSVARATGSSVLDLDAMVCPQGRFQSVIDGITIRLGDGVHFAPTAGTYLAPRILSDLLTVGRGG